MVASAIPSCPGRAAPEALPEDGPRGREPAWRSLFVRVFQPARGNGYGIRTQYNHTPAPSTFLDTAVAQRERPIVVVAGDLRQLDLFEHLGEPPTRRVIDARRFGALVREARRTKGLTLRQAARLTDLSRSALGNIETATYPPGPMVAARLIARLELLALAS